MNDVEFTTEQVSKKPMLKSIFGASQLIGERQIHVVASTPTPDRVKDVMVPDGCDLTNYRKNPIVLADHNPSQPIGTADVEIRNGQVEATITFAPEGASRKADEYCALAKAGVLNTVSVGFMPMSAQPIKGGGFSIDKWELMELSLVAVPCNPDAIVTQRAFDTRPTNWKCGASLGLPIRKHDGEVEDVLTKAGFYDERKRDIRFAAKAHLAYDASKAGDPSAYAIRFAKVVEGRLMVDAETISAAREEFKETELPAEIAAKAEAVLTFYEEKLAAHPMPEAATFKETDVEIGPARAASSDLKTIAGLDETLRDIELELLRLKAVA